MASAKKSTVKARNTRSAVADRTSADAGAPEQPLSQLTGSELRARRNAAPAVPADPTGNPAPDDMDVAGLRRNNPGAPAARDRNTREQQVQANEIDKTKTVREREIQAVGTSGEDLISMHRPLPGRPVGRTQTISATADQVAELESKGWIRTPATTPQAQSAPAPATEPLAETKARAARERAATGKR